MNEYLPALLSLLGLAVFFAVVFFLVKSSNAKKMKMVEDFCTKQGWKLETKIADRWTVYRINGPKWTVERRSASQSTAAGTRGQGTSTYFFAPISIKGKLVLMPKMLEMFMSSDSPAKEYPLSTDLKDVFILKADADGTAKFVTTEVEKKAKELMTNKVKLISLKLKEGVLEIRTPKVDKMEELKMLVDFGEALMR